MCLYSKIVRAHEGWGIVVDNSGNIYFADIPQNKIWKFSRDGKLTVAVPDQHSHALIKSADGSIYGSHENGRIWKLTSLGQYQEIHPPSSTFPLSLHSFIIDGKGSVYSMNAGRIQSGHALLLKRSIDGKIDTIAGGNGGIKDGKGRDARFLSIDGMAWSADSFLYITDGPYVRKVSRDGVVTTITSKLSQDSWEDLMGIFVSKPGAILVADYAGRRILKVSSNGTIEDVLNSSGIWSPTGISEDGNDLYILEHLRGPLVLFGNVGIGPYMRIQKITANKQVITLTTVWGSNTFIPVLIFLLITALIVYKRVRKNATRS